MLSKNIHQSLAIAISIATAMAIPAASWGFQKTQSLFNLKPDVQMRFAKERGIALPGSDVKNQIQKYSPSKFLTEVNRKEENPATYQSYLYEVRDGRRNVEEAKLVAANVLFTAIESNWKVISTTQFNDKVLNGKGGMTLLLNRKFENLIYLPNVSANKDPKRLTYTFEAGDWGVVKLVKNTKTNSYEIATWSLDISSTMDDNTLAPEAENIAIAPRPEGK